MGKTKKAIGYVCDIPVPKTGEVVSKEDQRARIFKYVEKENLNLVCVFEDDENTEDFISRPGVQKILNYGENFDVLLVERIWCLSRKIKRLKPFLDRIDERNAQLLCSSCLWDYASQNVRHRYSDDLYEKMRQEARALAAAKKTKKAA